MMNKMEAKKTRRIEYSKKCCSNNHLSNQLTKPKHLSHHLTNKKAQIKIQEMAFVLLALVFLFILAFLFFTRLNLSNIEKRTAELREERALSVLGKISAMPELRCSASLGKATETLCLDKSKIEIFSEKFTDEYENIWRGLSSVKILEVFPNEEEYIIYYKNEGNLSYSNFVSLCQEGGERNEYRCSIGMILVSLPA